MPWLEDLKFPRGYQMGTHILENKAQQIEPEATNHPSNDEKKEPLQSVNVSNKDKNKYASAIDIESNKDIETKAIKNLRKQKQKL